MSRLDQPTCNRRPAPAQGQLPAGAASQAECCDGTSHLESPLDSAESANTHPGCTICHRRTIETLRRLALELRPPEGSAEKDNGYGAKPESVFYGGSGALVPRHPVSLDRRFHAQRKGDAVSRQPHARKICRARHNFESKCCDASQSHA